ncbi:restriction endonuclease [Streptomyces sp. Root1310]|uniref:restriction endonuclease n=1 Tax=Streptomyces sp. Root1310 TaxID=1736452 RepID=UPI00070FE364|nr:restriction endonuclease [Streptomyces sp. Root1310]KQX61278.1 restriction endonuclease [Streptomyces sp. Root1310]
MAVPPHVPQPARSPRRFELRSTAVYFVLLAVLLTLLGTVARTAAAAAQHRPAWAVSLVLVCAASVVAGRRGRRRFSAARLARRAAKSLEEATETVVEALETAPPVVASGPAVSRAEFVGGGVDVEPTIPLGRPLGRIAGHPLDDEPAVTEEIGYEELDPYEFEEAIAELCRRDGCTEVEVVGGAGDLGADVVGRTPDGRVLVIQCKRYSDTNRVGSQDMQRFGGTCFAVHGAEVAAVVTTGDFTAPAVEYASQCGIVCVDGEDLGRWQDAEGPRPWEPEFVAVC